MHVSLYWEFLGFESFSLCFHRTKGGKSKHIKFKPKGFRYPIYIRSKTTDYTTFIQIFCERQYDIFLKEEPSIIIDCGGNIGLTSVFFKNKYPNAKIITIEPEINNYKLLVKNTNHYTNIVPLRKGIWNKSCYLRIINPQGNNDAFIVEESPNITDIQAISLTDLIKEYNIHSIDILKIDIEGSEKELFDIGYENWLPLVKVLVVELHDLPHKNFSYPVLKALSEYKFNIIIRGQSLVCYKWQ
jgi:FkbM family methyltransferase